MGRLHIESQTSARLSAFSHSDGSFFRSFQLKEVLRVKKRVLMFSLLWVLGCCSVAMAGTDQLRATERRDDRPGRVMMWVGTAGGQMGVRLQSLTPQLAEFFGLSMPAGALVSTVEVDSPAAKAGLKAGDVIISVGGERVIDSFDAQRTISRKGPGAVEVVVMRDKQERRFTVQLEKVESAYRYSFSDSYRDMLRRPARFLVPLPKVRYAPPKLVTRSAFRDVRVKTRLMPKFRPAFKVRPVRERPFKRRVLL
jgi:PDZ domain-containing protein